MKITDVVDIEIKLSSDDSREPLFRPEHLVDMCCHVDPPGRCNPHSLIKELEEEGHGEAAEKLRRDIAAYKCSTCGKNDKVGIALMLDADDEDSPNMICFCVHCSGDHVKEIWERG